MQSAQTNINIGQLLGVLRRRLVWIVLCFVIVAGAAYGFSKRETKQYKTTAALVFNNNAFNQELAGLQPIETYEDPAIQEKTDVRLIRSGDTAARTAAKLGGGLTARAVRSSLAVEAETESDIVNVTATSTSPPLAAAIANTYTSLFAAEQKHTTEASYEHARRLVEKQFAALPAAERTSATGIALQERAESLAALAAEPGTVQVAQTAGIPGIPFSPRVARNTALGAVLGLLLGLGLAFLLEHFDRRLREPQDLEGVYRVPLLGVVPQSGALSASRQRAGRKLPPAEIEAFQLIRAHLRYFNVDRELRALMIASATPGDGKTTIACQLAAASATIGSRVLLLECDLRRPRIVPALGLPNGPGLADVLIGSSSLTESIRSVDTDVLGYPRSEHMFDVLTAGSIQPPNPGELIESQTLRTTLEHLRSIYDLVVIDTPPLGPISDAFSLLSGVDGVILVGRLNHNRRDVAERLRTALAEAGAPLLGVIANGFRQRRLGRESYGYGYDHVRQGRRRRRQQAPRAGAAPMSRPQPSSPVDALAPGSSTLGRSSTEPPV